MLRTNSNCAACSHADLFVRKGVLAMLETLVVVLLIVAAVVIAFTLS